MVKCVWHCSNIGCINLKWSLILNDNIYIYIYIYIYIHTPHIYIYIHVYVYVYIYICMIKCIFFYIKNQTDILDENGTCISNAISVSLRKCSI